MTGSRCRASANSRPGRMRNGLCWSGKIFRIRCQVRRSCLVRAGLRRGLTLSATDEEERAVETPGGMSPDASEAAFEPDRGDEVEDEDENEDDEDAAEEEDEDGEDVDEAAEDDTIAKPGKSGKRVRRTVSQLLALPTDSY